MSRARVSSSALAMAFVVAGCDFKPAGPPRPTASLSLVVTPTSAPARSAPAPAGTATLTPAASVGMSTPDGGRPSALTSDPPNPWRYPGWIGTVYDERGAVVDGAVITVRSLDASVPYQTKVTTKDGAYEIPDVPEGANVEIVATRAGWTTRRRVASFQQAVPHRGPYVIDFGAPPGTVPARPSDAAYFLSDRPEIVAVEPVAGATDVDPTRVACKLTVSEPLDATAREALAAAIVLWPANASAGAPEAVDLAAVAHLAAGGDGGTDRERAAARDAAKALVRAESLDFSARPLPAAIGYQVRVGDQAGEPPPRATATWNAAGTEMTVGFPVALRAGELDEARYQIGLVAGDEPIRDPGGLPLGTPWDGGTTGWPAPGRLVGNAFYTSGYKYLPGPTGDRPLAAWNATHSPVSTFEARRDDQAPRLVDLTVRVTGDDLRLAFRFDEAMAAFDGTPGGFTHPALLGQADGDAEVEDPRYIRSFVFALGMATDDLMRLVIDGPEGELAAYDPAAGAPPRGAAFAFAPHAVAPGGVLADAATGRIVAAIDPADARVVMLTVKGGAGLFDGADALAVRVVGLTDPAGNRIPSSVADEDVVNIAL